MKIMAFNGSPRKTWNTATLLGEALEGAAAQGAETELVHLYDLNFKGCLSCFACKLKGGKSYGRCGLNDDLTPLLKKVEEADALLVGAPIYLGTVSGMMQAFLERLLFPYFVYDAEHSTLFKKRIRTGLIFTFGADVERMTEMGYDYVPKNYAMFFDKVFGAAELLLVNDTYQFDDYSKYETSGIDVAKKTQLRKEVFPEFCKKAYDLGAKVTQGS